MAFQETCDFKCICNERKIDCKCREVNPCICINCWDSQMSHLVTFVDNTKLVSHELWYSAFNNKIYYYKRVWYTPKKNILREATFEDKMMILDKDQNFEHLNFNMVKFDEDTQKKILSMLSTL